MPGSGKKKKGNGTPPVDRDKEDESMDQDGAAPDKGKGVDPAMLELLMSIKHDINNTTNAAVGKINDRIDANATAIKKTGESTANEIRKLRQHVEESQAAFESKISRQIEERDLEIHRRLTTLEKKKSPVQIITKEKGSNSRQLEAFNKARRSLKVWPVSGADLQDSFKVYLKIKLRMDDDRIGTMGPFTVRPAVGRNAKDKSEVLVQFDCVEDRDYVKSLGFNLSSERESGMSIHVPGHLLDNYYALNSIGYNIRQNQEGVKRSIKFDDAIHNIYLDILIGGKWRKILPEEARAALKATPASGATNTSRSIEVEDLVSLVRGDAVPGLTAVVVPADPGEAEQQ